VYKHELLNILKQWFKITYCHTMDSMALALFFCLYHSLGTGILSMHAYNLK